MTLREAVMANEGNMEIDSVPSLPKRRRTADLAQTSGSLVCSHGDCSYVGCKDKDKLLAFWTTISPELRREVCTLGGHIGSELVAAREHKFTKKIKPLQQLCKALITEEKENYSLVGFSEVFLADLLSFLECVSPAEFLRASLSTLEGVVAAEHGEAKTISLEEQTDAHEFEEEASQLLTTVLRTLEYRARFLKHVYDSREVCRVILVGDDTSLLDATDKQKKSLHIFLSGLCEPVHLMDFVQCSLDDLRRFFESAATFLSPTKTTKQKKSKKKASAPKAIPVDVMKVDEGDSVPEGALIPVNKSAMETAEERAAALIEAGGELTEDMRRRYIGLFFSPLTVASRTGALPAFQVKDRVGILSWVWKQLNNQFGPSHVVLTGSAVREAVVDDGQTKRQDMDVLFNVLYQPGVADSENMSVDDYLSKCAVFVGETVRGAVVQAIQRSQPTHSAWNTLSFLDIQSNYFQKQTLVRNSTTRMALYRLGDGSDQDLEVKVEISFEFKSKLIPGIKFPYTCYMDSLTLPITPILSAAESMKEPTAELCFEQIPRIVLSATSSSMARAISDLFHNRMDTDSVRADIFLKWIDRNTRSGAQPRDEELLKRIAIAFVFSANSYELLKNIQRYANSHFGIEPSEQRTYFLNSIKLVTEQVLPGFKTQMDTIPI